MDLELCAYSIATHDDLAQEIIYLIANAKDLDIDKQWELVNKYVEFKNK